MPDIVRQDLVALVPASIISEITCFVFYDNHPRDKKNIDITICTGRGEVKEFHRRELVNSAVISSSKKPQEVQIMRNSKCEHFYLIGYEAEVVVLSRKVDLQILHHIYNVERYEIEDLLCTGVARLKIICRDDGMPMLFDDNFDKIDSLAVEKEAPKESLPLLTTLDRKLTEARFSVQHNEKVLKDLLNLRHQASYSQYRSTGPNADNAVFQDLDSHNALECKTRSPWVKVCNKKLIIVLEVVNRRKLPATDIYILLNSLEHSMVYTTQLFQQKLHSPFWSEMRANYITSETSAALAAIINLEELNFYVTSKIEIKGVITYKVNEKECILPFDNITLSPSDIMGESFDVLSDVQMKIKYIILATLATTEKTELCLRHIKNNDEQSIKLIEVLSSHLHMDRIDNANNVIIHRQSPYHTLHGTMLVQETEIDENKWIISLYTRSSSQVPAFIHYLQDKVPYRIIATSTTQKITSKIAALSGYDEDLTGLPQKFKYTNLKTCLSKQATTTLDYLDMCMMKMNASKNTEVQSKVGREIDVFSGGHSEYVMFRRKILDEALKSVNTVPEVPSYGESEDMNVDSD